MSCPQLLLAATIELSAILQNPSFSSVYRTKAMYVENQEDFYNMVACGYVADEKDPFTLLSEINAIEAKYGRNRGKEIRFGPRSLDIDIELFGNKNIKTEKLTVPHERITEREFVLVPLLEILENSADKVERQKYQMYLEKLRSGGDDNSVQKLGTLQAVLSYAGTESEQCSINKDKEGI